MPDICEEEDGPGEVDPEIYKKMNKDFCIVKEVNVNNKDHAKPPLISQDIKFTLIDSEHKVELENKFKEEPLKGIDSFNAAVQGLICKLRD